MESQISLILASAANSVATGHQPYTCNAIRAVNRAFSNWYNNALTFLGANGMVTRGFSSVLYSPKQGKAERLMFMAWLITMVKEGEVK